ncbi:hypothetical protein D3C76_1708770 [compost metagenome]
MQSLTHPLGEGGPPAHEHRHVGPELHPEIRQFIFTQTRLPEVIERHQGGGRIRGAAADAAAHGQVFFQPDVGPLRAGQFVL